ncbi:MAG: acetoacetate--CoA ligase [Pseudomonadales bacterium]|nr:acetoacetate--CoA ligase [Pseudomonadales bacterium]
MSVLKTAMSPSKTMNPVMWQPTPNSLDNSAMAAFMRWINEREGLQLQDYPQLHAWSIEQREIFWKAMLEFSAIQLHQAATQTLIPHQNFWQEQWFPGCKLNYAENLLHYRDERTALVFYDEAGNHAELSYAALYAEVTRISHWLRAIGIEPGSRVAGFAANRIETLIAMLATAAIGAIWTSCSPDFGANGIIDRFQQIEPSILFAVSSHLYAGKTIDHGETLKQLSSALPSLQKLVLFPELYQTSGSKLTSTHCEVLDWKDLTSKEDEVNTPLHFHSSNFADPLFIMYSSGTTGRPKCIVHGVGGTLLQHRKEHLLHLNLHREDIFFYFTTCGWMMWNWLSSGLASGATLVLYDGSPFHPQQEQLFHLAEKTGITVFGTSAKYLSSCEKAGLKPAHTHDLSRIHTLLSTGSPLPGQGYDYVYHSISPDAALQSISGGTDIISCFVLGCPLLPVYRGEIQCAGLGMDVAIFNESGQPVVGQKGELVCRQSFPSMPVCFWNDVDNRQYMNAYFKRFPGVWTHGDYAEQTAHGTFIISGRSDTVLNPGGVRIGTAEIYRQVETLPEIIEAVVVGRELSDDVEVVLFVRLQVGVELDEQLLSRIRQTVRRGASPRHVPAKILAVTDIPRTLSGKIAEIAVRETLNGRKPGNEDALANPQCLAEYRELARTLNAQQ